MPDECVCCGCRLTITERAASAGRCFGCLLPPIDQWQRDHDRKPVQEQVQTLPQTHHDSKVQA